MEEENKLLPLKRPEQSTEEKSEDNAVGHCNEEGRREGNKDGKSFKRRYLIYGIICFVMFDVGWCNSMLGPAFPDLMQITGVSSGAGSVYVATNHAGMFVGSFLCGLLIDRYNEYLVMAFASFCFGGATFAFPMCSIFWTMILANAVQGFGCGMLLTGAFTKCGKLCSTGPSARSFMQLLQLCFPFGSMLSPLVVSPFLSSDPSTGIVTNTSQEMAWTNMSYPVFNDTSFRELMLYDKSYIVNNSFIHTNRTPTMTDSDTAKDKHLVIPFSISTSLVLLLIVLLIIGKCIDQPGKNATNKKTEQSKSITLEKKQPLSLNVRILRLYLVGQLGFLHAGSENSFVQFFPEFLHRKLGWRKILGSDIMLAYWGFNCFSRIIGIVVSYYIKSSTYVFLDILIYILSWLVALLGTYLELDFLMWVSAGLYGIGSATLWACLMSWCHSEILSTSGEHNSYLMLANCIGSVVLPLLFGNLMELDYVWFVYVLLTTSILLLVDFLCLVVFVQIKLRNKNEGQDSKLIE